MVIVFLSGCIYCLCLYHSAVLVNEYVHKFYGKIAVSLQWLFSKCLHLCTCSLYSVLKKIAAIVPVYKGCISDDNSALSGIRCCEN